LSSKVKIFVAYHRPFHLVENCIFKPIHVGKSLSRIDMGLDGDDTGINISQKNKKYAELTLLYWIWKNIELPEYVGLAHYRRFLSFAENNTNEIVEIQNFMHEHKTKKYLLWDEKVICNAVEGFDIVLPKAEVYKKATLESQYEVSHPIEHFELMIETAKRLFPESSGLIEEARNLRSVHYYNMFVMKKELFLDYMEFLFPICEEMEKNIDFDKLNGYQYKVLGFIGERIFNVYLHILHSRGGILIREQNIALIQE